MSCEHLICARCSSPVVEGRCPTCRVARAEVHHHGPAVPSSVILIALVLAFALAFALALQHLS
jgi:hypothetical protein